MGPARFPLPGIQIHLFTFGPQPKMEVHLTSGHLSSHLPSHPFFPALQRTLLLLKFSVPSAPGGGWGEGSNSCPHLSSAGAWPFALGQHGVWDDRKPRESLDPGAGGDLARPWDRMCSGPEAEEGPRGSSSCPLPPSILGWGIHGEGRMGQRWQVRG